MDDINILEIELSENLEIIKETNKKCDNLLTSTVDDYIKNSEVIKKKYFKLKEEIIQIISPHYDEIDEKPSHKYLVRLLENLITELDKENEELYKENNEIKELNNENNKKLEKIENEIIEIFSICRETLKNDILDNLILIKRKIHYNLSLFNILYILFYIIFYFYIFYNIDYIYIYILLLLSYFYFLFK